MTPKILIGIATRGGDIYPKVIQFLFTLYGKENYTVCIQPSPMNVAEGQSKLFTLAYANNVDYLILMDSDIVPPIDAIERLIATGKDIVTAPIWFTHDNKFALNISYQEDLNTVGLVYKEKTSGVEKIAHSSFGCICISRKVLAKFKEANEHPILWSPLLDEKYLPCYTDAIFHAKARKLGFQAWIDWDIKGSIHYKLCELSSEAITKMRAHGTV